MRLKTKLVSTAIALASASLAYDAMACGGTFCDQGPRAMPVDQTGENIIFVMESGMVEAHIQIGYKGEPAKFSWLLPVQKLPQVEVGCEALFDRLLQATVPTYGTSTVRDFCSGVTSGPSSTGSSSTTGTGGSGGSGPGGPPGGVVIYQKPVGAFEVAVLGQAPTADLLKWLSDNQYQTPPMAQALFDAYVTKGYYFVAVKLTGGTGIDQIHPLVVRYPGTQPCVPLKLTAVGAIEDMGVRTFFLGNKRVVPTNYKHVVPNTVKLDWFNPVTAYTTMISGAADSPLANGHAFVTEYAGSSALVGAAPIAQSNWNPVVFTNAAVTDVVTQLQMQNLLSCSGNTCAYNHPLLLPLLREYVPAPAQLKRADGTVLTDPVLIEGTFYSCLSCYKTAIDMTKWDGLKFAQDMAARIVDPAKHADLLLDTWPYLTRMFTTISPAEMTEDPEFKEVDGLGNVQVIAGRATQRIDCANQATAALPDGRMVSLPMQSTWPRFAGMPWAERIEDFASSTQPVVLADNRKAIDDQLAAWNSSGTSGSGGSDVTTGMTGGTLTGSTFTTGGGSGGMDGTGGGVGTTGGAGGANSAVQVNNAGCGCRTSGEPSSRSGPLALFGLAALAATRRRRARGRPD